MVFPFLPQFILDSNHADFGESYDGMGAILNRTGKLEKSKLFAMEPDGTVRVWEENCLKTGFSWMELNSNESARVLRSVRKLTFRMYLELKLMWKGIEKDLKMKLMN